MLIQEPARIHDRILDLKNEVEQTFGRKVASYGDCVELSKDIFKKTGQTLNVNTLRRFFGLVAYHNLPSGTTLNIFSRYCGYSSFDQIQKLKQTAPKSPDLNSNIIHFLTSLFEFEVSGVDNSTYISVVKRIVWFLNQNVHLKNQFHQHIARNKNGKIFYFEEFVNIDGLNSFYGEGLKYYLYENEVTEELIFGRSLLIFKYWLCKDDANLEYHYQQQALLNIADNARPSIAGRHYAARLFYVDSKGISANKVLADARSFRCNSQTPHSSSILQNSFEFIFAQALVLTKHFEESLEYIKAAKTLVGQDHDILDSYYQSLSLYEAYALLELNRGEKAAILLESINPEAFLFLSRKMDSIIYLIVKSTIENSYSENLRKIKLLIGDTGYFRFDTYIEEVCSLEQK